jgi:hypothetical protein
LISDDQTPEALAMELRRVLDAYRHGTSPGATQQAALWRRLEAPIGAAAVAKASLGLRLIVGGLIVGATTIVGVAVSRPDAPRAEPTTTTVVAPAPPARSVSSEATVPETAIEPAIERAGPLPPTPPPVSTSARERRAPSAVPSVDAPAAAGTLTEELALLERARIELGRGRPTDALALVAEHAREFPRGQLQEERLALRIIALCDAKQLAQGRGEARAFLSAHPEAALAGRIRAACEIDE